MKTAILMPWPAAAPVGGYKVLYEYAKRLGGDEIQIDFFYVINIPNIDCGPYPLLRKWREYFRFKKKSTFSDWFDFGEANKSIKHHVVFNVSKKRMSCFDVVIATAVQTVLCIERITFNVPVIFFVQGYENYVISEKKLIEIYQSPRYRNIAVSGWLGEKIKGKGADVDLILPNGINKNEFSNDLSQKSRDSKSVCMMYHTQPVKRSKLGLHIILKLKEQYPDMKCTLFSIFPRPASLPSWILYHHQPSINTLRNIYNQHSIFLFTSQIEGFGLPPAEAMSCGACVVTSDCGGVQDFCINSETAVVINGGNADEYVRHISDLFGNDKKRKRLSDNGLEKISSFNWDENVVKLNSFLKDVS